MGNIVVGYGAYDPSFTHVYTVEKQPIVDGGHSVAGIWETVDVFIGTEDGLRLAQERVAQINRAYVPSKMVPIVRVAKRKVIDR